MAEILTPTKNNDGGQDVHFSIEQTEAMGDMMKAAISDYDKHCKETFEPATELGRMERMEASISDTLDRLKKIDEVAEPGKKYIQAHVEPGRWELLNSVGDTMVHAAYAHRKDDRLDRTIFKADQSGETHAEGNALIPDLIDPKLWRLEIEASVPAALFNRVQMANRRLEFPVNLVPPNIYWSGYPTRTEGTAPPNSNTAYVDPNPSMETRTQIAVSKITNEVDADAIIQLRPTLTRIYMQAGGREETHQALMGKAATGGLTAGTDPFNGITNLAGVASKTLASGELSSALEYEDILALMFAVDPSLIFSGQFIMNTVAFQHVMNLRVNGNPIFVHTYNTGRDIQGSPLQATPNPTTMAPGLLLGRPVYLTDTLDAGTAAAHTFMLYGDFTNYAVYGVRQGLTFDFSPDPYFLDNALAMRMLKRVAFQFPITAAFAKLATIA